MTVSLPAAMLLAADSRRATAVPAMVHDSVQSVALYRVRQQLHKAPGGPCGLLLEAG